MNSPFFIDFLKVVSEYAKIYETFEMIQKDGRHDFMPVHGDQKTGIIGESFVYEYFKRNNMQDITFGGASEKGWDIEFSENNIVKKIQVKTVSIFSKTRTISPIHYGWDELYLVSLNTLFQPDNIWVVKLDNVKNWKGKKNIAGLKMPKNDTATCFNTKWFDSVENITTKFYCKFTELKKS
ncbi:MAG: hypothetical protein Ta2B_16310 [Termitinemataceae bacterium]|nr:MAG: hypothetical protein Ta2B_16310 [Termitinemataceae bacterium]